MSTDLAHDPTTGRFVSGRPKTGGRAPGVPNRNRSTTIDRILQLSDPIGALCKIANGEPRPAAPDGELVYPTMADQLTALRTLAGKIMPDLKQVSVDDSGTAVTVLLQLARVGPPG
jgi:hypothetical protein